LHYGTCIFFGAGVSKLAGYPLWNELRDNLVDFFWNNKNKDFKENSGILDFSLCEKLKKYNPLSSVDYLYNFDKKLFNTGVRKLFNDFSREINSEIYLSLNKLNNGKIFFVTTNIDLGFQNYLGLHDEKVSIYPELNKPPKLITYLHGRLYKKWESTEEDFEQNKWILTTSQYREGYDTDVPPCKNFLKYIFENFNVIFIGYGLNEERVLSSIPVGSRKKHFWLEGLKRNNIDYLEIQSTTLKNYNIQLIPYCIDREGPEILNNVFGLMYSASSEKGGMKGG